MKKQITHLSIHQTSKVIAAMHTAMVGVLFILPTVLGYWFQGHLLLGLVMLILLPLLLWVFLYIGYVIACWFYNLVVPWMGGIELELTDVVRPVPEVKVILPEEENNTISGK